MRVFFLTPLKTLIYAGTSRNLISPQQNARFFTPLQILISAGIATLPEKKKKSFPSNHFFYNTCSHIFFCFTLPKKN